MKPTTINQLLQLNQQFYDAYADDFSQTRRSVNPGFAGLVAALPQPCTAVLDVACGNGRFGQYLQAHTAVAHYVGVDFSARLLAIAPTIASGEYHQRDLSQPGSLAGLGQFDAVVCLAALHHIPGQANRVQLLQEMAHHLRPHGRILLSTWQFMSSTRQQRKVRDWAEVGLTAADVEPGDYLLTWQRGGFSYRYVCLIDEPALAELAAAAGLRLLHHFRSDGKEGDLSLYTVLEPTAVMTGDTMGDCPPR
jgi:alkylated DNA repair protein alkB family protein 8